MSGTKSNPSTGAAVPTAADPEQNFRFYDNRQKYLMFVNTCSEKWVIASRVAAELNEIHPTPPAIRVFDAGVGDGTVLARIMRTMHRKFEWMPFYVVGKEISLEDVRLALEKMADRFMEHPATVLVMTNMKYDEAPLLTPNDPEAVARVVWHEVELKGTTAGQFDDQITALQPFLAEHWRARISPKSGNPMYETPTVLVIYRQDCKFLLDTVRPKQGSPRADFDLILASQPYRARASVEFKARRVIAPLVRGLSPGGRLIGIHSSGNDPGLEIIQRVWPDENPFESDRYQLLKASEAALGGLARDFQFLAYDDERSLLRYEMHTLPTEIGTAASSIGTSTLLAAWNAATYVAQIEDHRLAEAMSANSYIEATRDVLREHGALWFWDECYIIARKFAQI